jgi:hypothetical protein
VSYTEDAFPVVSYGEMEMSELHELPSRGQLVVRVRKLELELATCNEDFKTAQALLVRNKELELGLKEINEIRNNIVRFQNVNWSRDIYLLVMILDRLGFELDPTIREEWKRKTEEFVKQFCPECRTRLPEHNVGCSLSTSDDTRPDA